MSEGDQSSHRDSGGAEVHLSATTTAPPALRIVGLLLLDSAGNDPVTIDAITVDDDGIGVTRSSGDMPRTLPWSSVSAHVVERWAGGVIPARWVDPARNGVVDSDRPRDSVTNDDVASRPLPHADPGAVIAIQTPFGTYRFLVPGGHPTHLSNRITDFAVRHQGLSGVPSITMVARPRQGDDRRQGSRSIPTVSTWSRVQPYLVAALVVFLVVAITLILLQSAGRIHLPFLGGANSGAVGVVRSDGTCRAR